MDPFSTIASRVLYEERVTEGLKRLRWARSESSKPTSPSRPHRPGLLAALMSLLVG